MAQTAITAPAFTVLDLPGGDRNLIGLARVSTDGQDAQLQQDALTGRRVRPDLHREDQHPQGHPSARASPPRSTTCAPVTRSSSGSSTAWAAPSRKC